MAQQKYNMIKYPKIVGWVIVGGFWLITGCALEAMKNKEIVEASDTAEDMIGWIVEDVANGRIDSTTADTYIYNLEEIIIDLGVTR
jgi:hypothetical protein